MLAKRVHRLAVEPVAQRLADGRVGGVAREQPEGQRHARLAAPVLTLGQPQIEEGAAVNGLHQRLHHAAHARRHAAGEDHHGQLAGLERRHPARGQLRLLVAARLGQAADVGRLGRQELTLHVVLLRAAPDEV